MLRTGARDGFGVSISLIRALNDIEQLTWRQRACLKAIVEYCKNGKTTHRVKYRTVSEKSGIPIRTLTKAVRAGESAACLSVKHTGRSNIFCWHIGSAKTAPQLGSNCRSTVQGFNKSLIKDVTLKTSIYNQHRDSRTLTEKVLAAHNIAIKGGLPDDIDSVMRYAGISNPSDPQRDTARKILIEKCGYQQDQQNGRAFANYGTRKDGTL